MLAPSVFIGLLTAVRAHVHVPQLSVSLSDSGLVRREVPRVVRCSTTKGAFSGLKEGSTCSKSMAKA